MLDIRSHIGTSLKLLSQMHIQAQVETIHGNLNCQPPKIMKGVDVCKCSSSMVLHIKGGERSCWESCGMPKPVACLFLVSIH